MMNGITRPRVNLKDMSRVLGPIQWPPCDKGCPGQFLNLLA